MTSSTPQKSTSKSSRQLRWKKWKRLCKKRKNLNYVVLATRGLWSDAARRSTRSRHSRHPSRLPNSRHCPESQARRAAGLHENKKRRQQTRACGGLARGTGHPAARVCRRATQWFGVLQTRRFPTHAAGYLEIQPAPHPEKTRTRTGGAQHFSALSHYRDGDS